MADIGKPIRKIRVVPERAPKPVPPPEPAPEKHREPAKTSL